VFGDDYSTMELAVDEPTKQLYQVEPPFGADIAGVDDKLFALNNAAEFDTWLTVGADNGNVDSAIRCADVASSVRDDMRVMCEVYGGRGAAVIRF
jgi:hypothetical protein